MNKTRRPRIPSRPGVSVVLPCRNEGPFIRNCVLSILENGYPRKRMEILVVDGRSEDGTREEILSLSKKFPGVRLIDNPKRITPAAFNAGIKASRGPVVLIMGAHAFYPKGYVEGCLRALRESGADNAGGLVETRPREDTLMAGAIAALLSHPFGVGNSAFRVGVEGPRFVDTVFGGCYKREIFDRLGLFDERLVFNQDLEFNLRLRRAGGRIYLDPSIRAQYFPSAHLVPYLKNRFRDGCWALLSAFISRTVAFRARHIVPAAFFAGLGCLAILSGSYPVAGAVGKVVTAVYATAGIFASVGAGLAAKKPLLIPLLLILFPLTHGVYALGTVWGGLRGLGRLMKVDRGGAGKGDL